VKGENQILIYNEKPQDDDYEEIKVVAVDDAEDVIDNDHVPHYSD
jgi:hypothetical protein